LLRGVYNRRYNDITKDKAGSNLIFELWAFCNDQIKVEIWIKRWEKRRGYTKRTNVLKKRTLDSNNDSIRKKGKNNTKTEEKTDKLLKNNKKIL
jgi:hypothetical protein